MAGPETQTQISNTAPRGSDGARLNILYESCGTKFIVSLDRSDLRREFRRVLKNAPPGVGVGVYTHTWTLLEFLCDEAFERDLWDHVRNSRFWHVLDDLDDDEAFYVELEIRDDVATEIENGGTETLVFGEISIVNIDDFEIDCEVDTEKKIDVYYYENADAVELPAEFERIENECDGGDQFIYVPCLLDDLLDLLYVKNPELIASKEFKCGRVEYEAYEGEDGDLAIVRVWMG